MVSAVLVGLLNSKPCANHNKLGLLYLSKNVGGMLAMQDAVVLANWINVLPMNPKMERIEEIFSYFQKERKQYIDQGFEHSKANSRLTRAVNVLSIHLTNGLSS